MQWASKHFRSRNPIRASRPKSHFFDWIRGSDCFIGKVGIEKALFQQYEKVRFSLLSETGLFDPRIRLHKDWRVVRIDQQQQLAPYSHAVVVEPRTNNRKLSVSSARASQANVYARTKKPVDPYVQYTLTRPAVSYHTSAR